MDSTLFELDLTFVTFVNLIKKIRLNLNLVLLIKMPVLLDIETNVETLKHENEIKISCRMVTAILQK